MTWVSSMYLSREFNFLSCLTVSVIFFVEQVFSLKKKKNSSMLGMHLIFYCLIWKNTCFWIKSIK